jgi:YidC/Oxa1 family membrane protein insertase
LALYWAFQNMISIAQAQIQRRYGKQPELGAPVKVAAASSSPGGQQKKKDKASTPRLGGGGTKSRK